MSRTKKRLSSKTDKPLDNIHWPWWQLFIDEGEIKLSGREQVKLSRHVINLRSAIDRRKTSSASLSSKEVINTRPEINFLKPFDKNNYSLYGFIKKLGLIWPTGRDLSLWLVLEIIIWLMDLFWLLGLTLLFKLHQEFCWLMRSVGQDIKLFFNIVQSVIQVPFLLIKIKTGQRYKRYFSIANKNSLVKLSAWRQAIFFLILAFVVILPLKGVATWQNLNNRGYELINLTNSGFQGLEKAGSLIAAGNSQLAQEQLILAKESFEKAQASAQGLNGELSGLIGKLPLAAGKLEAARLIISASQEITEAAVLAANTLTELNNLETNGIFNLTSSLNILSQATTDIKLRLSKASQHLNQVDVSSLPADYNKALTIVRQQLTELEVNLNSILSVPQLLRQLLVTNELRTYVIIFQNTSELRPTGGFAGSLALIALENGEVRSIDIPGGGPYDFQGSLSKIIRPPEPLRLVRGTWQLQDANWFFDFPTSARKIMWFLKESGGPETHGLVALNSDVVIELLKITGPIELSKYGKVLTADNFMRETQAAVEIEYDRNINRPKQFIADLAPELFIRLLNLEGGDLVKLSALVNASLLNRGLQLYSTDPNIQAQFIKLGWAGEIQTTPTDYLAIVRTNIGGGKTDAVIKEKIRHHLEISPTGELIVRLSLTRQHQGEARDTFESRRNVTYLRFYVPAGSQLLATQGFTPPPLNYYRPIPEEAEDDIYLKLIEKEIVYDIFSGTRITEEFGKTVFANWLSVSPGEKKTVELVYRLPWKLKPGPTWQDLRRYAVLFQRQSGVKPLDFVSEITWPENFRLRWQESSRQPYLSNNKMEFRSDWQQDDFYGIILEKM